MATNYKSRSEFHKKLELHLHAHANKTGEDINRLRKKIAFDRLLARIFSQEPSSFFLKGGYAMELRSHHARATRDIDLTRRKYISITNEPVTELIQHELQTFARIDLNDHFIYKIGQSQSDIENAPYGGSRHSIAAMINNKLFIEFHLDVGVDFLIDHTEKIQGTNWLEFWGISAPVITMISVEQQFAEKLHCYTFPWHQINTRSKDLIDLLLLLRLRNNTIEKFSCAVQRIFKARNTHLLPDVLPKPPEIWDKIFTKWAFECGIPQNLKEGFLEISNFYSLLQQFINSK